MDLKKLNKEVSKRYNQYPQYNRHLVEINQSQIPNAGLGLFAKQDIPKDTIIDIYHGKRINGEEFDQIKPFDDTYVMCINDDLYIDGKYDKCMIAFTNDARGLTRISGMRNNCYFEMTEDGNNIAMKTSKNIKAGSELFCYYGDTYWRVIKRYNKSEVVTG